MFVPAEMRRSNRHGGLCFTPRSLSSFAPVALHAKIHALPPFVSAAFSPEGSRSVAMEPSREKGHPREFYCFVLGATFSPAVAFVDLVWPRSSLGMTPVYHSCCRRWGSCDSLCCL